MKSVMTHQFSKVPQADIQRSTFDRSHGYKTTFDAGTLVPFFLDEALPGDTFNLKTSGFGRLATPIYPLMDNIKVETFFFFVPTRLVWDNFKKFMGEQTNPGDSIDYTIPVSPVTPGTGTIMDYFGLPIGASESVNNLPFRAYNLIWDEWFRDQNLQSSTQVVKDDTTSVISNTTDYLWYELRRRGKRHDYFTSCLPWPQKGESVDIPIGTQAPITGIGVQNIDTATAGPYSVKETETGTRVYNNTFRSTSAGIDIVIEAEGTSASDNPLIYADLTNATAATINQLRQAFQIQRLLERDARGGTRYVELIKSHFGVSHAGGDARLQRPEYLGGGSSDVNITPIAQTSETSSTPQGNLSAMGTFAIKGDGFTKSFTEHGYIIGLVNARADLTYQQGVNRLWSRSTRYDFYWPSLAHIGEQAVLNKEIYLQNTSADEEVFGYQERYAEYRYKPSVVTGLFRSDATGSLDAWHLAQDFDSLPVLNSSFIEDNPPIDRVIAVPSEPQFILDTYFDLKCARPMPLYGVPGLIDHF